MCAECGTFNVTTGRGVARGEQVGGILHRRSAIRVGVEVSEGKVEVHPPVEDGVRSVAAVEADDEATTDRLRGDEAATK